MEGAAGVSTVFTTSNVEKFGGVGLEKLSAVFAITKCLAVFCGAVVGRLRLNPSGLAGVKSKKRSSELQAFFHSFKRIVPRSARGN